MVQFSQITVAEKKSNLYVVVHESTGIGKVWMFGVDVRQLDSYQVVNLQHNHILSDTASLCRVTVQ